MFNYHGARHGEVCRNRDGVAIGGKCVETGMMLPGMGRYVETGMMLPGLGRCVETGMMLPGVGRCVETRMMLPCVGRCVETSYCVVKHVHGSLKKA